IPEIDKFIQRAQIAGVYDGIEEPILQGRDLMPEIEPGPEMGKLVHKAYEIQLNTGIRNKAELKRRILQSIKKAPHS
ncbi:hypothetical protein C4572_04570, partial [Candidatus Parcubacteria bacterium]